MQINLTGHHIEITPSLKDYIASSSKARKR